MVGKQRKMWAASAYPIGSHAWSDKMLNQASWSLMVTSAMTGICIVVPVSFRLQQGTEQPSTRADKKIGHRRNSFCVVVLHLPILWVMVRNPAQMMMGRLHLVSALTE